MAFWNAGRRMSALFRRSLPPLTLFCSSAAISKDEATALDMIKYCKSLKVDNDSLYAEATRVLRQGMSFFSGDEPSSMVASARVQLALATLHASRSDFELATECLQKLISVKSTPLEVKGAALEALIGIHLELHEDELATHSAKRFSELLKDVGKDDDLTCVRYRAAASNKLVHIVDATKGDNEDLELIHLKDFDSVPASSLLAFAESFHVKGFCKAAKDYYEKAIHFSCKQLKENHADFSAAAMVPEAVHIGALAGLGQLLTSMGKFDEAESQLTEALKHAEKIKGEKHAEVGIILSCIGYLYRQRGVSCGSNDSVISEGLFKRALDLMKAPPLDKVSDYLDLKGKDRLAEIIALTRARLAVTLAPSPSRYNEVEKLRMWSKTVWKMLQPVPGLVLEETPSDHAHSDTSKIPDTLIDVRLGRVLVSKKQSA